MGETIAAAAPPRPPAATSRAAGWPGGHDPAILFDLPALPLDEALQRYTQLTGRSVIYDTGRTSARRSAPLRGRYGADEALDRLLAGSGMDVRHATARAVSLVPRQQAQPPRSPATASRAERRRYYAHLQTRVLRMLCGRPGIEPGRDRVVIRFRIGPAATVESLQVVAEGRPRQEAAVRSALAGRALPPPPPGFGQPVTMLLSPGASKQEACPS